jgi:tetratricopeptide (TPR) repeat protein
LAVDENGKTIRRLHYHQWDLKDLMQFNIIGQPSVVIRRSIYEQAGGISAQYQYLLDHHLWLRIAASSKIGYVPELWSAARFHKAAKNIAHAAAFGEEASKIATWLSEDEKYASIYEQFKKQIWAGAYRFGARYLSEGKQYQDSLVTYRKAWKYDPFVVLRDWKRVGVTLLGRTGLWK